MFRILSLLAFWCASFSIVSAQSTRADLNLVIAVDGSWSVNRAEYNLQAAGIAAAFADPAIIEAITTSPYGRIGVLLVHWSTKRSQVIAQPWTIIDSPSSALAYSSLLLATPRLTNNGGTSITGILKFAQGQFLNAPMKADRRVIDVIADGTNNDSEDLIAIRDRVVAQGTTINALAVLNEVDDLDVYLARNVIGGPGAFVQDARDYQEFKEAFRRKLLREVKGAPVTGLLRKP